MWGLFHYMLYLIYSLLKYKFHLPVTLLTCSGTPLKKMQHYFHCLTAHKLQKLLHADTVTTLAFPNNLKSLPVPLCLSALLPLYSQITATAPTQSLTTELKNNWRTSRTFFPCLLPLPLTGHFSPHEIPEKSFGKHVH